MTKNERTETTKNPNDEPIIKKKWKISIPIITAGIAIISAVGAFVYINNQKNLKLNKEHITNIVKEKKQSELQKKEVPKNKIENIDFGYKGNLKLNMKIPQKEIEKTLKLNNFEILSMDKWLKTVVSFDSLSGIDKQEWINPIKLSINNFDITTNEENTYIHFEWEQLKHILESIIQNPKIINSLFDSKEYIKIDGAKPIIELLWSDNGLLNSFIKGLVSSNPVHYWDKYWITKEIKKRFLSKNSYKLFFRELKTENGKTYVGLKDHTCEFVLQIANKIWYPIPINEEDCKTQLIMINDDLWKNLYITQKDNVESINYNDETSKMTLSYNNGKIILFTLESPFTPTIKYKKNILSVSYNSKKLWDSLWMYAKLNLGINLKSKFYKIWGNYKKENYELKISGQGNNKKWKIIYMLTKNSIVVSKGQIQYMEGNYWLNIISPFGKINWKLINNKEKTQWQISGKWKNKFSRNNSFENTIDSKWLLKYNSSGEINTIVINLKSNHIANEENSTVESINGNLSLKDGNLKLLFKDTKDGKENLQISWNGKWTVNDTDVNLKIKVNNNTSNIHLTHKDGIAKSSVDFGQYNLILNSEIVYNSPVMSIIGALANIYSVGMFKDIMNLRDADHRRLGDIWAIERALETWLVRHEKNPDGKIPTRWLTPISYKWEIIAYQGNFSDYFNGALKDDWFDVLQKAIKDPDGVNDYIISISTDGKTFSIATVLENSWTPQTQIIGNFRNETPLELKNWETISIPSLIYEQKDGKPIKTQLEILEDLNGFLKDNDPRIIYNIVKKDNKEDGYIVSLKYNTSKAKNKSIINGTYNISKWNDNIVSVSLEGDISKEWFTYKIPTNVKEIDWFDYILSSNKKTEDIDSSSTENSSPEERDEIRKTNLSKVSRSITMYYNDEGEFPKSDKLINLEDLYPKIEPYIVKIPKNPSKWKKYYYMSLKNNDAEDWAAILITEMENEHNCNLEADSIEQIQQIIEDNNYEYQEITKLIVKDYTKAAPCFYVIFPDLDLEF